MSCLTVGLGMALAMLFVSIHELVPMAKRYRHLVFFFWGMALSVLVYALLAALTVGLAAPPGG